MQPHTSAGRVPSSKGYRLYVDKFMQERVLSEGELEFLRNIVHNNIRQMDELMRETAKAIAMLTNYTTVLSKHETRSAIKHIQLMPYDDESVLLTVVMTNKSVCNLVVRMRPPPYATLSEVSVILSKIESTSEETMEELCDKYPHLAQIIEPVFHALWDLPDEQQEKYYTTGVKNLLAFPEFSDIRRAKELMHAIEEKNLLSELMNGKNGDISVIIGEEIGVEQMKDCSIIKVDCVFGGQNYGTIGIIGPKRMDYEQVVSLLSGVVNKISEELGVKDG
jgi:heat-inducible transcriptional repressor